MVAICTACKSRDALQTSPAASSSIVSLSQVPPALAPPGKLSSVAQVGHSAATSEYGSANGVALNEREVAEVLRAKDVFQWLADWSKSQTQGTAENYRAFYDAHRYV